MLNCGPQHFANRADGQRMMRKMWLLNHYKFLLKPPSGNSQGIEPAIIGTVRIPKPVAQIIADYATEIVDWVVSHTISTARCVAIIHESFGEIDQSIRQLFKTTRHTPDVSWFSDIPIYLTNKAQGHNAGIDEASDLWSEYNDRDAWEAALEYIVTGQKIDPAHISRFLWHIAMFMRTFQSHF